MKNYKAIHDKYLLNTYKRNNLLLVKAKGKYVWDYEGKKYLDFFSGLSVSNVGHCAPTVVKAIKQQADKLLHVSNLYYTVPQIEFAKSLSEKSLGGKVFLCNSGAEAAESAIKIARKYGGGVRDAIITFTNSFHGRTLGALSATAQEKFQKYFKPMLGGFSYAKFNDIESVNNIIGKQTVAIMIEPIQGEGGVNPAKKEFLQALRALCDENKILLIFDEVQCGLGRTGKLFAYEYYGVKPDIIFLAKSLGGGLPLGAVVVDKHLNDIFSYGDHGTTFGGNPVACASGIEVLKLLNKSMLAKVQKLGEYFRNELEGLAGDFDIIGDVRGVGLMLAIELKKPASEIVALAQEKGLLINCTQDYVLRFLPPLIIEKPDIDYAIKVLRETLKSIRI